MEINKNQPSYLVKNNEKKSLKIWNLDKKAECKLGTQKYHPEKCVSENFINKSEQ